MPSPLVRFDPDALASSGGGEIVYMSPERYLELSPPMGKNPMKDQKGRELRESVIDRGEAINQVPSLKIDVEEGGRGKVMGQDGRHRAEIAKEQGVRLIPVRIEKKGEGEISSVISMRGEELDWDAKKPKKWSAVASSDAFKAMPLEQQNRVRARYFDDVVAPTLPQAAVQRARGEWRDKWQAKASTGPDVDTNPAKDMSGFDLFRAGAGKAMFDLYRGAKQRVGLQSPEETGEQRKTDTPLMNTSAGTAGNVAGNMALFAPTAAVPGASSVLGSAGLGALAGFFQPTTSSGELMDNTLKGGGAAAGLTALARAAPMLKGAFVDPFMGRGQERIALAALARFAKDPEALKSMNITELVKGSRPSLAEVTGDPGIAQLQRGAQAKLPEVASAFADARTQRLAARKEALAKVAGDEGEKEFFQAARDATAERLYGEAYRTPINPKKLTPELQGEIKELMDRPSMKEAVKRSYDLAREEGLTLKEGEGDYVRRLHYTKKALDEQIEKAHDQPSLQRALLNTKDKLIGVIDQVSPKYAKARAQYEADSKPISRMEIGGYLRDKLLPALNEFGTERYRPEDFAKALRDGDAMARKATGFKGARLADILTQEQQTALKSIAEDVGREAAAAERAKVPGSPTGQYLAAANLIRQIAGPLGLPESWVETTIGKTLAHWTSLPMRVAEERVAGKLGEMLAIPKAAAEAAKRQQAAAITVGGKTIPLSKIREVVLPPVAIGSGSYAAEQ